MSTSKTEVSKNGIANLGFAFLATSGIGIFAYWYAGRWGRYFFDLGWKTDVFAASAWFLVQSYLLHVISRVRYKKMVLAGAILLSTILTGYVLWELFLDSQDARLLQDKKEHEQLRAEMEKKHNSGLKK